MAKSFNSFVRYSAWFLLCLPLLTSQQVKISQSQVVRLNETLKVACTTNDNIPIHSCTWSINNNPINLEEGSLYQPLNDLKDGRCGVKMDQITEDGNGEWECTVFLKFNRSNPATKNGFKAETNVTVVALPKVSITTDGRQDSSLINVSVDGKEKTINCLIINVRPAPTIIWKLGDKLIPSNHHNETFVGNVYWMVNVTSTLKYIFLPKHNNKLLSCEITDPWLTKEDPHESSVTLNVMYFLQPKEEKILCDFVLGQPGAIIVNFTTYPRPSSVLWKIDNEIELVVVPFSRRSHLIDNLHNFKDLGIKILNPSLYEVRLNIDPVMEEDLHRQYRLVVKWENQKVTREIPVRLSTKRSSNNNQAIKVCEIVSISLIAVCSSLLILAVVYYTRETGRLAAVSIPNTTAGAQATDDDQTVIYENVMHVKCNTSRL